MHKLILILILFIFPISCASAEETDPPELDPSTIGIIGEADGPTAILIGKGSPIETSIADLEEKLIPILLDECTAQLHELSGEPVILDTMTSDENTRQIAAAFHADSENGIVSWNRITNTDLLTSILGTRMDGLSVTARSYMEQRFYSASFLSSILSSMQGVNALAASSLVSICRPLSVDLPSSLYIAKCENGTGIIMGIWNNGDGIVLVTASFVPSISSFEESDRLGGLFR